MMKIAAIEGDISGMEFPLRYEFTSIGREEGVDIHIPGDTSVSRRHAVIKREFGNFVLQDLGSTNGTYLVREDGSEEEIAKTILTDGKIFRIGKTTMKAVEEAGDPIAEHIDDPEIQFITDSPSDVAIRTSVKLGDLYSTNLLSIPEDQKSIEELNHKIKVFYDIGMALGKIMDLDELLEKILDNVFEMFPAQRAYLILFKNNGSDLETKVVRRQGEKKDKDSDEKIEVSSTIINQVVTEKKAVLSDDARLDERFGMPDSVFLHDIRATLYAPLMLEHEVLGVLCIDSFTSSHIFTENDLRLLSIIANQAAQSIENARLHNNLKRLFVSSIKALANAIEARDVYTRGHSERVTEYAVKIAEKTGLERDEVDKIRYAALLHDIGKINIPEDILNKPGRLTDEEFYVMKQHPVYGARIMEPVEEFKDILPYVYYHHETCDKRGYPEGLGREEIPLASRILGVADSFDAMTSDRPYRRAMSIKSAVMELEKHSGTQFDPEIVKTFIEAIKTGKNWLTNVMRTGVGGKYLGTEIPEEADKDEEEVTSDIPWYEIEEPEQTPGREIRLKPFDSGDGLETDELPSELVLQTADYSRTEPLTGKLKEH